MRLPLICLASDNLEEPWILYEAGALSKRQGDQVWTVLLDVENEQVKAPLGQFQHSKAEKDDLYKVIQSINGRSPKPKVDVDLKRLFEALWPQFDPAIDAIRKLPRPTGTPAQRSPARNQPRGAIDIEGVAPACGRNVGQSG